MTARMRNDKGEMVVMPAVFRRALGFVFRNEGGFVDDPVDRGGMTKYGITQRTYPREDIAAVTRERAAWLYYRDFWLEPRIPLIVDAHPAAVQVAVKVFDFGVNAGPPRSITALQAALNGIRIGTGRKELLSDGKLGPKTAAGVASELTARGDNALLAQFCGHQWDHYERIARARPDQRRFSAGWAVRAHDLP